MKRTQDLERQVGHTNQPHAALAPMSFCEFHFTVGESVDQVKELEQILKSRNPNSIPALIYAVANADKQNPGSINALLERRVQHLEAELESHEQEAKRSLQSMEQQFQRIKVTPSCLRRMLVFFRTSASNDCVCFGAARRSALLRAADLCAGETTGGEAAAAAATSGKQHSSSSRRQVPDSVFGGEAAAGNESSPGERGFTPETDRVPAAAAQTEGLYCSIKNIFLIGTV